MRKFSKILALLLSLILLVTMATACKSGQEDDWNVSVGDDSFSDDDMGNDLSDDKEQNENQGSSDKTNDKTNATDKNNQGNNDKGNSTNQDSDNNKDPSKENSDSNESFDQVVENYDGTKKYDMENNPLVAESKALNHGIMPSFDVDTTGFVKNNIKLADLKGKTFNFFTASSESNFFYTDENGKEISERDWFGLLKSEFGLTIKYTVSHHNKSHSTIMTYMNAGKALDLIPTHVGGMPLYFKLCQGINPYVNMQNVGNSPGVDEMTLKETEFAGEYHCIAPIGAVDMLVYNQSLVEELNLKDPHTMWQKDEWDWNAWRAFLTSVPTTTNDGKDLFSISVGVNSWWYAFPLTNGVNIVDLDSEADEFNLISNWSDERVLESLTFFADTMKSVKDGVTPADGMTGSTTEEKYGRLFNGTLMMSNRVRLMVNFADTDYAKSRKYNWVPYPKGTGESGRYAVHSMGIAMSIPKIVKNKNNIPYAIKFAELWANRCTEAMFDYFTEQPHLKFTYAQKKEYFEFCVKNTYFGLQMNEWRNLSGDNFKAMRDAANGYIWAAFLPEINMATKHKEVANVVDQAIEICKNYK